jgi:hypothetical protein
MECCIYIQSFTYNLSSIRLGIGVLNEQRLLCLASVSSLKFLSLNLGTYKINYTDSGSTPTSSSHLKEVDIIAPLPFVITHCLRNIQFISCHSVVFHMSSDLQLYDPRDIPDLIISIKSSNHAMRVSTTFSNVELMVSQA